MLNVLSDKVKYIKKEMSDIDNLYMYEIFRYIENIQDINKKPFNSILTSYSVSEADYKEYKKKGEIKDIDSMNREEYLNSVKDMFYKENRNYFALEPGVPIDSINTLEYKSNINNSFVYRFSNIVSEEIVTKGDIIFFYTNKESSSKRAEASVFYEIGFVANNPIELNTKDKKHGVVICFPISLNKRLKVEDVRIHKDTNDLIIFNEDKKSKLQQIKKESHYKALMSLICKVNPKLKSDFEYIIDGKINNIKLSNIKGEKSEMKKESGKSKIDFDINSFKKSIDESGLIYNKQMIVRFVASLCTKPFVILTGLSGSGKTQLALSFVKWICNEENTNFQLLKQALESDEISSNYEIKTLSKDIIEIANKKPSSSGRIIPLPTDLMYEWYYAFKTGKINEDTPLTDMRDIVGDDSKYQRHMNGFYSDINKIAKKMNELVIPAIEEEAIKQYEILPVGSEWTNSEPLLGFPNALQQDKYESPENGVLDILINANNNPDKPFFLILDEMNLSHVERYFSDFLSVMESGEEIPLYNSSDERGRIPSSIKLPNNLFIIGTVNIDETTYMFSPKVLDRANTIEFRIDSDEMKEFLNNSKKLDLNSLNSKGANMSDSFLNIARNRSFERDKFIKYNDVLLNFFTELSKVGSEFGYRSVSEVHLLIEQLLVINPHIDDDEILDIALMQKILPKLHGSRRKILPILKILADLCVKDEGINIERDILSENDFSFKNTDIVKYPLSLEKISRMYRNAIDLGYTSYSEA